MNRQHFGSFAFAFGLLVVVIVALTGVMNSTIAWLLIALGIIIGVINWLFNDAKTFLLSSVAIVLISEFGPRALIYANMMLNILDRALIVFVPVVIINALHLVFEKAKK